MSTAGACRAGVQHCGGAGNLLIQGTGLLCCRMVMIKELATQRPCTDNCNLPFLMP